MPVRAVPRRDRKYSVIGRDIPDEGEEVVISLREMSAPALPVQSAANLRECHPARCETMFDRPIRKWRGFASVARTAELEQEGAEIITRRVMTTSTCAPHASQAQRQVVRCASWSN
jgi:hypothetical protein